jgi:hypothetical protein
MSSQGSGSIGKKVRTYEEDLLEAWGQWVSGNAINLGYQSVTLITWRKSGPRLLFAESEILDADAAIAGLGKAYKKMIKRVFWFKTSDPNDDRIYPFAIDAFRESLDRFKQKEGQTQLSG